MEALTEIKVLKAQVPRTALEVFEMLPEGTLCEVINNALYMSPAPNPKHQKLSRLLLLALQNKLNTDKIEGELFYAPIDVFFDQDNAFQPDLLFLSKKNYNILNWEKGIMGAPDLVIEILSKSNTKARMKEKKLVYEKYHVQEFWIIDEKTKQSRQYWLHEGKFEEKLFQNGSVHIRLLDIVFNF